MIADAIDAVCEKLRIEDRQLALFVVIVAVLLVGGVIGMIHADKRSDARLRRKAECVRSGGTWVKSDEWLSDDGVCVYPEAHAR